MLKEEKHEIKEIEGKYESTVSIITEEELTVAAVEEEKPTKEKIVGQY